ncbi:hypothetical protein PoB_005175000 [Plakobranchus ocellatus]|uniref:Smoothelin domain-containing protein n=1 Tax=Plakobranchus ocellatus TaxID=259542 RepID=A0AAV4C1H4_9GAST|nr:hypothetical protein PoB_005175000 [Plakobranchus ocellatus]
MAAPNFSTTAGLASYRTGKLGNISLLPDTTLQSPPDPNRGYQTSSGPDTLQFLNGIRERLGRRGSASDLPLSKPGEKTPIGAKPQQKSEPSKGLTYAFGESAARRHLSSSAAPDLSKLEHPVNSESGISSRARSNFLSNFYTKKETGGESGKVPKVTGTGSISGSNEKYAGSFGLSPSTASINKINPITSSNSSSLFSSSDANRPKMTESISTQSREASHRNVLTPRGLSQIKSVSPTDIGSDVDGVKWDLKSKGNTTGNPTSVIDKLSSRTSTLPLSPKQVHFSDTTLPESTKRSAAKATFVTNMNTPSLPSKTSNIKNSTKPFTSSLDPYDHHEMRHGNKSPNFRESSPSLAAPNADSRDEGSPPGFPRSFPGPRRHSSFDAFSFANLGTTGTFALPNKSVASKQIENNAKRSLQINKLSPGNASFDVSNTSPSEPPLRQQLTVPNSSQTNQFPNFKRPSSPKAALLGTPLSPRPVGDARRSSLPDPSSFTKQQMVEALKNASQIRDKYANGSLSRLSTPAPKNNNNSIDHQQKEEQESPTAKISNSMAVKHKTTLVASTPTALSSLPASPSNPSYQQRGRAPSIPDIRGFTPIAEQQLQRRRSLRSDGTDGQDDQPLLTTPGSRNGNGRLHPEDMVSSRFSPVATQGKRFVADHDASYGHIDKCESDLELMDMLTACEDFKERRRIRARMRELKQQHYTKGNNTVNKVCATRRTFNSCCLQHRP